MIYFLIYLVLAFKIIYANSLSLVLQTFPKRHPLSFHTSFCHHDYLVTVMCQLFFILILLDSLVSEYFSY